MECAREGTAAARPSWWLKEEEASVAAVRGPGSGGESQEVRLEGCRGAAERPCLQSLQELGLLPRVKRELVARLGRELVARLVRGSDMV